jgi:phosphonate transport system substrate-binding protein
MGARLVAVVVALVLARGGSRGESTIRIGQVGIGITDRLQWLNGLGKNLSARMGDVGIVGSESLAITDNSRVTLLRHWREGRINVVLDNVATAKALLALGGTPIVKAEDRAGESEFAPVIFARRGSGVARLEDLRGKVVALEDRGSAVAFQMPLCELRRRGMGVDSLYGLGSAARPGRVGYVVSRDKLNTLGWVFHGKVSAGAIGKRFWPKLVTPVPAYSSDLEILWEGVPVPHVVVIANFSLGAPVVRRLAALLVGMRDDDAGAEILSEPRFHRFLPFGRAELVDKLAKLGDCLQ